MFNAVLRFRRIRFYCTSCDDKEPEPVTTNPEIQAQVTESIKAAVTTAVAEVTDHLQALLEDSKQQLKRMYADVAKDVTRVTGTLSNIVDAKTKDTSDAVDNRQACGNCRERRRIFR